MYMRNRAPQICAQMGGGITVIIDSYIKIYWVQRKYGLNIDMNMYFIES